MQRARHELLADAALAADEHRRLEVADLGDRLEDRHHFGALRENRLELLLVANLLFERAIFAAQRLALLGLAQHEEHLFRLERLWDVVVGAGLHRLERHIDVAVRAHDDDGGRVLFGLQRREQVEPAHFGHANVGEDEVGAEHIELRERVFAVVRDLGLVAIFAEDRPQHEADVLFVINDQHATHGATLL